MSIVVNVKDKIKKPVYEVWDAIINPEKINKYFVSKASAAIDAGKVIHWEFADYNVTIDIEIVQVVLNKSIKFRWDASRKIAEVEMLFSVKNKNETAIEITESAFDLNVDEMQKAMQQTQGWTDFICSLKAYLYTGINLRSGKFN